VSQEAIVVVVDDVGLGLLLGEGVTIVCGREKIVLASAMAGMQVEIFGARITLPQVSRPRPLSRHDALKGG
jgi:hypothetical protein